MHTSIYGTVEEDTGRNWTKWPLFHTACHHMMSLLVSGLTLFDGMIYAAGGWGRARNHEQFLCVQY